MYYLEEREGYWRIMECCKVEKSQGVGPALGIYYTNLRKVDQSRASDFLFGFTQGAFHCTMVNGIGGYIAGEFNDPPSEDYLTGGD